MNVRLFELPTIFYILSSGAPNRANQNKIQSDFKWHFLDAASAPIGCGATPTKLAICLQTTLRISGKNANKTLLTTLPIPGTVSNTSSCSYRQSIIKTTLR